MGLFSGDLPIHDKSSRCRLCYEESPRNQQKPVFVAQLMGVEGGDFKSSQNWLMQTSINAHRQLGCPHTRHRATVYPGATLVSPANSDPVHVLFELWVGTKITAWNDPETHWLVDPTTLEIPSKVT